MPDSRPHYWAFLSYSHADARWANRLHRALEHFATPRRLIGAPTPVGPAPRRLHPIFRDREELGASADLGGRLVAALEGSGYLIVVCSPASARSRWVNEEIARFRATHGHERILAVIVDGKPFASLDPDEADQECFPEALRRRVGDDAGPEPIAADLRPERDGLRLAVLKLAAGMLGVGLDELVRRDARRRQGQLTILTAASLAASAVLAALTFAAVRERDEAYAQRAQAEGLIEFMIGDLRKKLEPIGGLDALDAVGDRALRYYAAQQRHGMDDAALGRRARVLHMLGEIRDRRGDLAGALALFQEAARSTRELLARAPNDPQRIFDHAQSVYWVGYVAWRRGHDDEARRAFRDYQTLADRLVAIDPKNAAWREEVVYANSDLGAVFLADGEAPAAAAAYQRAVDDGERLVQAAPDDRGRQFDLAQNLGSLESAEYRRDRLDLATRDLSAESALDRRMLARNPADNGAKVDLAVSRTALARVLLAQGRTRKASDELAVAQASLDQVIASAPGDELVQVRGNADHAPARTRLAARRPAGCGGPYGRGRSRDGRGRRQQGPHRRRLERGPPGGGPHPVDEDRRRACHIASRAGGRAQRRAERSRPSCCVSAIPASQPRAGPGGRRGGAARRRRGQSDRRAGARANLLVGGIVDSDRDGRVGAAARRSRRRAVASA